MDKLTSGAGGIILPLALGAASALSPRLGAGVQGVMSGLGWAQQMGEKAERKATGQRVGKFLKTAPSGNPQGGPAPADVLGVGGMPPEALERPEFAIPAAEMYMRHKLAQSVPETTLVHTPEGILPVTKQGPNVTPGQTIPIPRPVEPSQPLKDILYGMGRTRLSDVTPQDVSTAADVLRQRELDKFGQMTQRQFDLQEQGAKNAEERQKATFNVAASKAIDDQIRREHSTILTKWNNIGTSWAKDPEAAAMANVTLKSGAKVKTFPDVQQFVQENIAAETQQLLDRYAGSPEYANTPAYKQIQAEWGKKPRKRLSNTTTAPAPPTGSVNDKFGGILGAQPGR